VQLARSRRLSLAFCTRNRGLADPGSLKRPGISRSWPKRKCEAGGCGQGVCAFFESGFTELDSLAPDRGAPLAHLTLKDTAQTVTRTK
jgi:hypothetical protein